MLEQHLGQRIVGSELREYVLVGRRLARRGLAHRRQLHLVEQVFAELLGRPEIEWLAGELKRLLLERHDLAAELAPLRSKQRTSEHHPVALHTEENLAHG